MRVDPRFNGACMPLDLVGKALGFVDSVEFLGLNTVARRYFRCSFEHVKLKFFRVFKCIDAKSKAAGSEINTVKLFKSYCIPYITYASMRSPTVFQNRYSQTYVDNLIVLFNGHRQCSSKPCWSTSSNAFTTC